MAFRSAWLVVAASALLLAGCATPAAVPPGLTDAEADEIVTEYLDDMAAMYDDSDPEPVRRVAFTSPDTWSSTQVTCLRAAGFDAQEISGGFSVQDGPDDRVSIVEAQLTCQAQFPVDPRLQGYLSEAQRVYAYDYFSLRLAPCIRMLGYAIGPTPARDSFLELRRPFLAWTPYQDASGAQLEVGARQLALLNARCPPIPDDAFAAYELQAAG